MGTADIMKMDLYGILEVHDDATEKEIVKAYRKKALKCHPDKNPDNPEAVELFQQLSRALEILSDPAARAAFDKARKAKKAAAARHKELDAKRKKFKEDLEAREQAFQSQTAADVFAARNLEAEIERLRKEGSSLLEREQERLREELKKEKSGGEDGADKEGPAAARLKVKWKAAKDDPENGGYSQEVLRAAFEKYGEVTVLVVSKKRNGSAIVEFASAHNALLAVQHEVGLPQNPVSISWLSGQPAEASSNSSIPRSTQHEQGDGRPAAAESAFSSVPPMSSQERDFESLVLMRLRQAEERKRLIEQMQKEDAEDEKT